MYLHGLEGSPNGIKGAWMQSKFAADAPELPARFNNPNAFAESVLIAQNAVQDLQPTLIVGSSFGGAVLLQLHHNNIWTGPSIFLAQAGVKYGLSPHLPYNHRAILIHAKEDKIIPIEGSRQIQEQSGTNIELWIVNGDHRLHHIVEDGTLERAINTALQWPTI